MDFFVWGFVNIFRGQDGSIAKKFGENIASHYVISSMS